MGLGHDGPAVLQLVTRRAVEPFCAKRTEKRGEIKIGVEQTAESPFDRNDNAAATSPQQRGRSCGVFLPGQKRCPLASCFVRVRPQLLGLAVMIVRFGQPARRATKGFKCVICIAAKSAARILCSTWAKKSSSPCANPATSRKSSKFKARSSKPTFIFAKRAILRIS